MWYYTSRKKKLKLQMPKNKVLTKMFRAKRDEVKWEV
jgi:hypothetical protein